MKNPKTIAEAIKQGLKAGDKITIELEVTHVDKDMNAVRCLNKNLGQVINLNSNIELHAPPPIDLKKIVYHFEGRRYEINFTTSETK